jgi:hypothetical protein
MKLPIESDRWQNLEIKRRICDILEKNETEEEFHVNVYRLACNILQRALSEPISSSRKTRKLTVCRFI